MDRVINAIRWLLGYRGIPLMSRPTFRYELINSVFLGLSAGVMGPEFAQLFARKGLEAPEELVASVVALFALGNLFGTFIGPYLQRRRRIRYGVAARGVIAAVMLAIAALPADRRSAVAFVALLLVPFMLNAVILNIRSGLWHSNYPADVRGQIFSRRLIVVTAATAIAAALAGRAMDQWSWAHRMIYPLAAACVLASAASYSRIRVRREASMRRASHAEGFHVLEGFRLLAEDRQYGRFMAWQMLSGCAALLSWPIVALALVDVFGVSYGGGTTAMMVVPLLTALVMAPLFGRMFDTVGITRFRALGAAAWSLTRAAMFVGFVTHSWACIIGAAVVHGVARAMGGLAFTIGHTHFAQPHKSQTYMGIHMTLQGLRGLTMPFLGVWLYRMEGVGINVLWIGAAVQLVAAVGFALSPNPRKGV